jgi:hypothetical protein
MRSCADQRMGGGYLTVTSRRNDEPAAITCWATAATCHPTGW